MLDLATGDGAVLLMLRAARLDLKLTGIDSARKLPRAPAGVMLKGGVGMERLPFPDRRFDLVTSQFGIEYGDVAAAAAEASRVLRPGGQLVLLVHHAGGPVVAHNRARALALQWVLEQAGYWERARSFAASRALGPLPVPAFFAEAVREAEQMFPGQSGAAEVREAVRRTLEARAWAAPDEITAGLDELRSMAAHECTRIAALLEAARDEPGAAWMGQVLGAAGLIVSEPALVREGTGRPPFAWLLQARR